MRKFTLLTCSSFLFAMLIGVIALPAMADIVPIATPANSAANAFYASGQGYGTVYTLVDLQWSSSKSASPYTEIGYAKPQAGMSCTNGVCSGVGTDDATNQERVYTLSYVKNTILGGGAASNLYWLFNISQQGSNDLISINDMKLIVYDGSFSAVQVFSCTSLCYLNYAPIAGNGQGAAGYGFHLDAAQAAILDTLLAAHPDYYLGGYASFGKLGANANDGSDNIALIRGEAVPEPATLLMLGSGILAAAGAFRRKFL